MVIVALAGASSGFGKTLLKQFLHLNSLSSTPHELIVLSRSPNPSLTSQGISVRPVDYTSPSSLVSALTGVHTLLSLIGGAPGALSSQLALLSAAQTAGVKRFAPSEYAGIGYDGVDLYAPKAKVWEATQTSGLEYARFSCGLFMSVLATGTPKPPTEIGVREGAESGEEEALAGLRPWNFVLNLRAGTADLAGTGDEELVLTDMRDVAGFVYAALSLEKWEPEMGMRGEVTSFRKLIEILERVQGRRFLVKETGFEELEKQGRENPGLKFYNQARIAIAKGGLFVGDELNRACPEIKPVTCEEFVEKWWSGVQLGEPSWVVDKAFGAYDM